MPPENLSNIERLFHLAVEHGLEQTLANEPLDDESRRHLGDLISSYETWTKAMPRDEDAPADARSTREDVPTAPTRYGAYAPVEVIGRGGMSVVYRANRADGRFEQMVALKVLAPSRLAPEFLRRFERERKALASLNHQNVATLLDVGLSPDGSPYLVTELVTGGTAIDVHCDERQLTVRRRLILLLQVCDAVDHAHRRLIVHGDLKPANILVNQDGVAKLLDFGTAVLMAADESLTITRDRMLTPRYASPEQLRGERITVASDIYSLGVVAHELLTGTWPFGRVDSIVDGLTRAVGRAVVAPLHLALTPEVAASRGTTVDVLRRALKGDLTAIVQKALADDPDDRYLAVRELADDIRRHLDGRAVVARGNTRSYRIRRFVRRYRGRIALVAATTLALFAVAGYGLFQYGRAERGVSQVRDLSEAFLTDIYREVSELPGSTTARLMIVERAQRQLDQVFADSPRDPRLRAALAQAYIQLAETQGEPFAISLGDSAGALVSYRKAEALVTGSDRDPVTMALLVRARQGITEVLIRAGAYDEARQMALLAVEPARVLWEGPPPHDAEVGRSPAEMLVRMNMLLGHAMMRAADVERDVEGVRRALGQFEQTVAIAEEARRRDATLPDLAGRYSQYVGYALGLLGDFTGDAHFYERALVAHRRSADASEANYSANPNPRNKRDFADGLCELGWCQRLCGRPEAAIAILKRALTLIEEVSAAHADSQETRFEVATIYFRLGAAEGAAGRLTDARAHLTKALALIIVPSHLTATDRETVVLVARIHEALAQVFLASHQPAAAVESLSAAVSIVKGGSSVPRWRVKELEQLLEKARGDTGRGKAAAK